MAGTANNLPFIPPELPRTYLNRTQLITARMKLRAQIRRAAGRMIHDQLLSKSVYADVAGAFQQRNYATDPKRGLALMWGVANDVDPSFNTLRHAVGVIAGRLESAGDRYPSTILPANLLLSYGSTLSSRTEDLPIPTAGAEIASNLVENGGILLDPGLDGSDVRDAISAQLTEVAAISNGITVPSDEYDAFKEASSVPQTFQRVTDEDLQFAVGRALRVYLQLASQAELDPANLGFGFEAAEHIASSITSLGGTVLSKGLPRGDLSIDITARAAGILGDGTSDSTGSFGFTHDEDISVVGGGKYFSTQDVFAMGEMFQRTLVAQQEELLATGQFTADDELIHTIAAGAAEFRSWAGPGRVVVDFAGATSPVKYRLQGFEWSDLGLTGEDDIASGLAIVYGPPGLADCAAGLRVTCPEDLEAEYVAHPTTISVTIPDATQRRKFGTSAPIITFEAVPGTPTKFTLPADRADPALPYYSPKDSYLYLVARATPTSKSRGRVIHGMRAWIGSSPRGNIVSDYRRELLNNVIGVSDYIGTRATKLGGGTTGDPKGYCIEGVPRDFFVPLENELTDNSDAYENSWRHYLTRARDTAQRSDQIADQILNLELQDAFHKEAAQEKLGDICGAYGNVDDLDFIDGNVQCSDDATDSALCQCINEPMWDLVFMSEDPTEKLCPVDHDALTDDEVIAEQTDCLKAQVLDCENSGHALCDRPTLSHVGLGLVDSAANDAEALPRDCETLVHYAMSTMQDDGLETQEFANIGNEEWREPGAIKGVVDAVRFKLELDGYWNVTVNGTKVMQSRPNPDIWPGCLQNPGTPCDPLDDEAPRSVRYFDELFRDQSARDAGTYTPAQRNQIMWRVQGAMWILAGLNQSAPAGYFELPVPAVDFTTAGNAYAAPPATVFGQSTFTQAGTGKTLDKTTGTAGVVDDADVGLMIASADDDVRLAQPVNAERFEYRYVTPHFDFIDDVYEDRENYLHIVAPTVARPMKDWKKRLKDWDGFMQKTMDGLNHAKCSDMETGTAGSDPVTLLSRHLIAAMKSGEYLQLEYSYDPPLYLPIINVCGRGQAGPFEQTATFQVVGGIDYEYNGAPLYPELKFFDDTARTAGENQGVGSPVAFPGPMVWNLPPLAPLAPLGVHWVGPREHRPCQGMDMYLKQGCAANRAYADDLGTGVPGLAPAYAMTRQVLRPSACSPQERAMLYTNFLPPQTKCSAASQFIQALGMACIVGRGAATPPNTLVDAPALKSQADIPAMGQWMRGISKTAKNIVRGMYFDSVPKRALESATGQSSNSLRGKKGEDLVAIASKISQLKDGYSLLSETLDGMSIKYDGLNIAIKGLALAHESAEEQIAMSRIQAHKTLAQDIADAVKGVADGMSMTDGGAISPLGWISAGSSAANGAFQVVFDMQMLSLINDMEITQAKITQNAIKGVMNDFTLDIRGDFGTLERTSNQIDESVREAIGAAGVIATDQEQAKYEAAQAYGAASFTNSDGETVDLPVNKVLGEQMNVYTKRYERTLNEARYLAYFARLAIEQRIGMRLSDIQTTIGNLEAPAIWADDVCNLKGRDYSKQQDFAYDFDDGVFHSFEPDDEYLKKIHAATLDYIKEDRSLMFIGDYVNQLENFVSFYNIEYPSKDADDVAVLSLVHDLLPRGANACGSQARNLLFYSGDLSGATNADPPEDGAPVLATRGWEIARCDADKRCLDVLAGPGIKATAAEAAPSGLSGPGGSRLGHVSWLRDVDASVNPDIVISPSEQVPARSVFQRVALDAGTYALSWSDRAVTTDGVVATTETDRYRVSVLDSTGAAIVGFAEAAAVEAWSERRLISFSVEAAGEYRVVFGASSTSGRLGSVAVADVQLEKTTSLSSVPSPYQHVDGEFGAAADDCMAGDSLRAAFRHVCVAGRCWHELMSPFVIDTVELESGYSRLANKIATGNFNFRHVNTAVNVVGTGVIDCAKDPSPDCYANSFLEYSLDHVAYDVTLFDHVGQGRSFNFGLGAIRNAKALATERLITQPISSTDRELIEQPQFMKPELSGRPLSGAYRFRVFDKPGLSWNSIEDIQFVMRHRFWSRVQRDKSQ